MITIYKKLSRSASSRFLPIVFFLLLCLIVNTFLNITLVVVLAYSTFPFSNSFINSFNGATDFSIHGTATSYSNEHESLNLEQSYYILPIVNENVTYNGDFTFTSSKPVQLESLNVMSVNNSLKLPVKYGTLYALNLKNNSLIPSILLGQPATTGTVQFSGNGLRVVASEPFIITFSFSGKQLISVLSNNLTSGINDYNELLGKKV